MGTAKAKWLAVGATVALAFGLAACSSSDTGTPASGGADENLFARMFVRTTPEGATTFQIMTIGPDEAAFTKFADSFAFTD